MIFQMVYLETDDDFQKSDHWDRHMEDVAPTQEVFKPNQLRNLAELLLPILTCNTSYLKSSAGKVRFTK